ncbi:MAG: hypothetical protein LUF02_08965 [Erysipelotrichaceae bacterium]|nr:hypothetical protein [Erysipelotrichaceae bacterium]
MSNEVKAFRASDNFNYKMKLIEEILKQNNIELNKTELFDEMIDLYYVHLVSGDDVLAKQVHICMRQIVMWF